MAGERGRGLRVSRECSQKKGKGGGNLTGWPLDKEQQRKETKTKIKMNRGEASKKNMEKGEAEKGGGDDRMARKRVTELNCERKKGRNFHC